MDIKPSRLPEDQIIGILREQKAGAKTADVLPQTPDQQCNVLQVEGHIRRPQCAKRLKPLEGENAERRTLPPIISNC